MPKSKTDFDEYEATPDEFDAYLVDAVAAGTTVSTAKYDSLDTVIVKSNAAAGGSNVTVRASTTANAAVDHVLAPGKFLVLSDVVKADGVILTAASGAVECEVWVMGT